jgi:hypothetical protein
MIDCLDNINPSSLEAKQLIEEVYLKSLRVGRLWLSE